MPTVHEVLYDVEHELHSAMGQHGPIVTRHEAHSIIWEELDEFWDEVKLNPAKMSPNDIPRWKTRMRKELTQVAAMAIRAIIDLGLPSKTND